MLSPEREEPPTPPPAAPGMRARTRSWLARQAPGGGDVAMDEEQERRHRSRVFQMGLFMCLLLLFADQRNGGGTDATTYGDNTNTNNGGEVNASHSDEYKWGSISLSAAGTQRLKEFLRLQPEDGNFYSRNVTGYYRGAWSKIVETPKVVEANPGRERRQGQVMGSGTLPKVEPQGAAAAAAAPAAKTTDETNHPLTGTGAAITTTAVASPELNLRSTAKHKPEGEVTLHHREGRVDMQLYMNPVPGLADLSLVHGYFKLLDGSYSTERDVYAMAKGVYLHENGRLLLRTIIQKDAGKIAFTFTLPASSAKNLNSTSNRNSTTPAAAGPAAVRANIGVYEEEKEEKEEGVESWGMDFGDERRRRGRRRTSIPAATAAAFASEDLHDLDGRMAAAWTDFDKYPEEERRLQAVLEEVVPTAAAAVGEDLGEGKAMILGLTVVSDDATTAGVSELVAADGSLVESVVIPNRSKNQYPRQRTSNGKNCVFTLDARTSPKLNSSKEMGQAVGGEGNLTTSPPSSPSSTEAGSIEERLLWVEGMEGSLVSAECNLAVSISSKAIRLDWTEAYRKAVNYSIVATLVCVLQIALLFRQLYFSRTQAAASRVSLLSVGGQAILDALLCIAHLLLCAMLQPLFAAFASIAFFKLVIFSIFEIRYMFIIHQSRNSQSATAASFNGLRRQLTTLHARFYAVLFFLLFLVYFLANYIEVIIFFLYSFWVPQIVMNATKGLRYPLNRTYVLGMSGARLVIPLYIYGCPYNFVHLLFSDYRPDYRMCVALVSWVGLQVAVLLSQDYLGPQYMIPARFLPPKYNYYRPVPQQRGGVGGGGAQPVGRAGGLVQMHSSGSESIEDDAIEMTGMEEGGREEEGGVPECAICFNDVNVERTGSYMVAPCNHVFDRECLERWMDIKLECPVCRCALPHR